MPPRVYVETSVVSYLAARPTSDLVTDARQRLTHAWWAARRSAFELVAAQPVLDEAGAGDPGAAARRLAYLAGLPLLAMLAVGLVVSVLQAVTQVQEPTLAFLPKLVAMALVLLLSGPAIGGSMRAYADALLGRIVSAGGMP